MDKNPHVVFFYMNGCPHCIHARPMWDAIQGDLKAEGLTPLEQEASNMPPGTDVTGFPTLQKTNSSGVVVAVIEGAPKDVEDLRKKLGLKKKKKGSGRKTRGRARRNLRTRRR